MDGCCAGTFGSYDTIVSTNIVTIPRTGRDTKANQGGVGFKNVARALTDFYSDQRNDDLLQALGVSARNRLF
jgi:hypothetical protein